MYSDSEEVVRDALYIVLRHLEEVYHEHPDSYIFEYLSDCLDVIEQEDDWEDEEEEEVCPEGKHIQNYKGICIVCGEDVSETVRSGNAND